MANKELKRQARKLSRKLWNINEGFQQPGFEVKHFVSVPGDGVFAVTIYANYEGKTYIASGGAKCNRTDIWNSDLGWGISIGRAMLRIAYQILKDRQESVKTQKEAEVGEILSAFKKAMEVIQQPIVAKDSLSDYLYQKYHEAAFDETMAKVVKEAEAEVDKLWETIKPEPPIDAIGKMKESGL